MAAGRAIIATVTIAKTAKGKIYHNKRKSDGENKACTVGQSPLVVGWLGWQYRTGAVVSWCGDRLA